MDLVSVFNNSTPYLYRVTHYLLLGLSGHPISSFVIYRYLRAAENKRRDVLAAAGNAEYDPDSFKGETNETDLQCKSFRYVL
jgi:hypothetical protein